MSRRRFPFYGYFLIFIACLALGSCWKLRGHYGGPQSFDAGRMPSFNKHGISRAALADLVQYLKALRKHHHDKASKYAAVWVLIPRSIAAGIFACGDWAARGSGDERKKGSIPCGCCLGAIKTAAS